jgi:acetolactate synthase I/II/III large subunit
VDESNTSGRGLLLPMTVNSRPHDWMVNTGGAIGYALPAAVGAAMACPDRQVLCLESDGSAMFTNQALWTMAREGLAVTTLILANRTYETLKVEMKNTGAGSTGPRAQAMLDIDRPTIDWVAMGKSMGVPGARASTLEDLCSLMERGLQSRGPSLIEVNFQ